ncbi:class I adenylate-forming enzyme family protein [Pseudokordiimonas caeni]|uniref:class I adenylate-forming enzyme family protein n=1 Tax=Pseudokordiimonas caeni TaxID=2997908 RepID=UPI00281229C1|nr:class I adenylate-forming enzyme family protein [Pseudokordiimonas caeni]
MSAFDDRAPLFPRILALHGRQRASKTALVAEGVRLTWGELTARMNRLAHALRTLGLDEGDRVGIVMSNGAPMAEALIGCIAAGLTSVPINLSVSDAALENMLKDAGAKAVIATGDQIARLQPLVSRLQGIRWITADADLPAGWMDFASLFDHGPCPDTLPDVKPATPMNIIYSSGTTGLPKGIVHTQAGRLNWARDLAITLRYDSAARTLFTIGLYSNISWVGFLATLLCGGTLYIENGFDARRVLQRIEDDRISHFSMVPIQYQRLLDVPDEVDFDLSSLKAVMSCGSPLHADLKRRLFARLGPKVIELYGLTEGLITTLDPEDAEGRWASVGLPLMGTELKLIDDEGIEVPAGTAGEIVGRGRIVMPGYWNRPEATAEATWTDPHGDRWLRTGDIGRFDEDGYLYIVDRKKDMILSGGQNIYPQDIEAVLMEHPAVSEAAVIGVKSERWGETPLAVVVCKAELDAKALLDWANARLGRQQRLTAVDFTAELPRNPNGKILKRDLRERYKDRHYG